MVWNAGGSAVEIQSFAKLAGLIRTTAQLRFFGAATNGPDAPARPRPGFQYGTIVAKLTKFIGRCHTGQTRT